MIINVYEYKGYNVEITENDLYHDFNYVIKTLSDDIMYENKTPYFSPDDADNGAKLKIDLM